MNHRGYELNFIVEHIYPEDNTCAYRLVSHVTVYKIYAGGTLFLTLLQDFLYRTDKVFLTTGLDNSCFDPSGLGF